MKKFDISALTVTDIVNAYNTRLAEETCVGAVSEHFLLIIKRAGDSVYTVGNKKYVADARHVVLIPRGVEYSLYVDHEGDATVIEFDVLDRGVGVACCEIFTDGDREISTAVKNILHYWTLRGPAYRSKCLSEIYSLLTQMSAIQMQSYSLAGKYGLIHRSVKYIETYYARQDLYTPMLAEMSGMGETYYRAIFVAVFGVAPTKYIQQYRVGKAKELLVRSSCSVEEIAQAVGFANSSYFCKVFKSLTGLTPSEFAERGRLVG